MINRRIITRPLMALACTGLATPLLAQSTPLGAIQPTSPDAVLGECPVDLLRAAWGELDAGTAVAIEQEVLDLCTDRLERIDRLMTLRAQVGVHLNTLAQPDTPNATDTRQPTETPQSPDPSNIADLRQRVDTLENRLARLDAGPANDAVRADLNAALEEARVQLSEEEQLQARLATAETEPPGPDTTADPGPTTQAEPATQAETITPTGGPANAVADVTPDERQGAPGSIPETQDASASTTWQVDHVVRAGDGPWRAQITGQTRFLVTIPAIDPADPPRNEWQTSREGPFAVEVGDALSDGRRIHSIDTDAVMVMGDSGPPTTLGWSGDGNANAPGITAWEFTVTKVTEQ